MEVVEVVEVVEEGEDEEVNANDTNNEEEIDNKSSNDETEEKTYNKTTHKKSTTVVSHTRGHIGWMTMDVKLTEFINLINNVDTKESNEYNFNPLYNQIDKIIHDISRK